ncbi:MAG: hypothetical protein KA802_12495 [Saprospiraceae bacterium]|nr:hypothetical protein [Saprospiraceae bacterium]
MSKKKWKSGIKFTEVEHLVAYILDFTFSDGTKKRVDFFEMMNRENCNEYLDLDKFATVTWTDYDICWGDVWDDDGIVVCAISIYEME